VRRTPEATPRHEAAQQLRETHDVRGGSSERAVIRHSALVNALAAVSCRCDMDLHLRDRVYLVTGGGRGLGFAGRPRHSLARAPA
jgi:hypothetical protein